MPVKPAPHPLSPDDIDRLLSARHADPFAVLGPHEHGRATWVTAIDPGAESLSAVIAGKEHPLPRVEGALFSGKVPAGKPYALRGHGWDGAVWDHDDAYRFGPVLGELDEYLLGEGTHRRLWHALGAHVITHEGVEGVHFAVWAPNAERVSVVGDFNVWDGRRNVMRRRGATGVWELFLPGLTEGTIYKYEIRANGGAILPLKADPVGFGSEHPPRTGSVVRRIEGADWTDGDWMSAPASRSIHRRADLDLRSASGQLEARRGQAVGRSAITNWPRIWSPTPPTWASPISS
jgi:1,4-alpha-glucan branching enzyme